MEMTCANCEYLIELSEDKIICQWHDKQITYDTERCEHYYCQWEDY